MMRYTFLSLLVAGILLLGCASGEVIKDEIDSGAIISAQNEQLSKIPFSGFSYKSSRLPSSNWRRWATGSKPVIEEVISKIPDGYVLQVTGHSDASGPEEPVGNKPGNIKISSDRALTVYKALRGANIDSTKLTYKGIGSSDILNSYDSRAAEQRRVTFMVVPR